MKSFVNQLKGGDLRSIGKADEIVRKITNQEDFDALFSGLFNSHRIVVMRTADAIEKITVSKPYLLNPHKAELLHLCHNATHIELKWHLALLVSRLKLTADETEKVWKLLTAWASNEMESKIVRVNSLQALFQLTQCNEELKEDFDQIINRIASENIPSLNARIKKLRYGP